MNKWWTAKSAVISLAVALCVGVMVGLTTGWRLWATTKTSAILENPTPAVRNSDGSLKLEKTPTAEPKPKQEVPKGAVIQRTISATVRTRGASSAGTNRIPGSNETGAQLPPSYAPLDVRFDATIYETPDGQSHTVVSSPDGVVIGGNDSPFVRRLRFSERRNAVGLTLGASTSMAKSFGVFYDRDWAWMRTSIEVSRVRYFEARQTEYEIRGRVGVRF